MNGDGYNLPMDILVFFILLHQWKHRAIKNNRNIEKVERYIQYNQTCLYFEMPSSRIQKEILVNEYQYW